MEVLVAVTAFAGALLAAITTGVLIGRVRDDREGWLIAWAVSTAALCVSLGVIATGHLVGFGTVTFRIHQLTGALLAPLWLALGVVQLLALKVPAKFVTWLFGIAFTIVASVILVLDPVKGAGTMDKTLPLGEEHWDVLPKYLITGTHGIVLLILLIALIVSLLRWRKGDDLDADNMHALVVLVPVGIGLEASIRFPVPGIASALVFTAAAGAVWYVVARPLAPYEDEEDDDEDEEWPMEPPQRRGRRDEPARSFEQGLGESPDAARERRPGGPPGARPVGGPERGFGPPGTAEPAGPFGHPAAPPSPVGAPTERGFFEQPRQPVAGGPFAGAQGPAGLQGAHAGPGGPAGPGGVPGGPGGPPPRRSGLGDLVAEYRAGETGEVDYAARMRSGPFTGPSTGGMMSPVPPPPDMAVTPPNGARHAAPTGPKGPVGPMGPVGPDIDMPATGALFTPADLAAREAAADLAARDVRDMARDVAPAPTPDPMDGGIAPGIYGLLTVFTLMDGSGEAFDRLAAETIEAVKRSEPDTLIFVCHSVKSAPLQRIVYELYRDEVAYHEHQRQPHMARFASQRVAHVLAANVIELNVNSAKVAPLPTAFRI
ncbi:antibiotic biosynthesis monooxygenase [Thermopolyspora sp. NPDC052614]|uniref:putative quinol monooxygenase n=1 Tax=Thermopolyspora sp. NPDC052614 TaxID=3155682 RepID=UPI003427C13E